MAQTNINPFGPGQQAADGLGIVNDLTTGGANVALSAEMGKDLNERLMDVEENGGGGGVTVDYDATTHTVIFGDAALMEGIILSNSSIVFPDTEVNGTNTATFRVKGRNLQSGIALSLSDSSGSFSLSQNSISAADANDENFITVTFSPQSLGEKSASIAISNGTITKNIALSGTAVAQVVPELSVNGGEALSIKARSGESATASVDIVGRNLVADSSVSLVVTGSGLSVSPASLIVGPNGQVNGQVNVVFMAGQENVSGTLTASQGSTSAAINVSGSVVSPLAAGSVITDEAQKVKYTVLSDGTVSVASTVQNAAGASGNVVIPATVNDAELSCVDENGDSVVGQGCTYTVTRIENYAFNLCSNLSKLTLPATITSTGQLTENGGSGPATLVLSNGFNVNLPNPWHVGCKTKSVVLMTPYDGSGTLPTVAISANSTRGAFRQIANGGKFGNRVNGFAELDTVLYVVDQATKEAILASADPNMAGWQNFADIKLISELPD